MYIRAKQDGEKRLFLFYGILNFLITNLFLHLSLLILPTLFSTMLSQFINIFLGYNLYGRKVFKIKKLANTFFRKYLLLAFTLWILNYIFINYFFHLGMNKNLAAIMIVPILVSISYLTQRNYVFK